MRREYIDQYTEAAEHKEMWYRRLQMARVNKFIY